MRCLQTQNWPAHHEKGRDLQQVPDTPSALLCTSAAVPDGPSPPTLPIKYLHHFHCPGEEAGSERLAVSSDITQQGRNRI